MNFSIHPFINASLNLVSSIFLCLGYYQIQFCRDTFRHRQWMVRAFVSSFIFLVSYGIYHFRGIITPYQGEGVVRKVYFFILISHSILAAIVPFLVVVVMYFAFQGKYETHKKWARVTFPIWLYVSITGVVIYLMLYPFSS